MKKRSASRAASAALSETRIRKSTGTVSEERLFRPDGHRGRVLTLDANSTTFTSDLTLMFEKNVARVRREHKRKVKAVGRAGHRV